MVKPVLDSYPVSLRWIGSCLRCCGRSFFVEVYCVDFAIEGF